MSDTLKWLLGFTVAALSFFAGGGVALRFILRTRFLFAVDQLKTVFVEKEDFTALRSEVDKCVRIFEFDAHERREDERYKRLIDDLVEPLRENSHTLQSHALALAAQQATLEHYGKAMDNLARSIDNLASQMIQGR